MRAYASFIVACTASLVSAQPLVSNFGSGIEGWRVETRTSPAGSFSLVGTYTPDSVASGGDGGSYIAETDPDNQWSFFVSPTGWGGDLSRFIDRRLRYSTRTDVNNYPDGRLVILVGAGGQRISHDSGVPEVDVWTRRQIRLSVGEWYMGTNASGALASASTIEQILTSFESLMIGLEFGGDTAEERVCLDSVGFGLCDADLNNDGQLNFFDVSAFLSAYSAMNPAADYNNDGVFNFFDVSAFLTAFNAGCP